MTKLIGILLGYVAIFFVIWNGLDYLNVTFLQNAPFYMDVRHNIVMPIAAGIIFFLLKHVFPMIGRKK